MAADALEKSVLESKDKDQLVAIATALGIKAGPRAKKEDIIVKILDTVGGPAASSSSSQGLLVNQQASRSSVVVVVRRRQKPTAMTKLPLKASRLQRPHRAVQHPRSFLVLTANRLPNGKPNWFAKVSQQLPS
ncbi:MAG: transcription termination factor Rho [Actinomycetota bacterium]